MKYAQTTLTLAQLHQFINLKTQEQGFTALHFTSFKGNPRLSKLLLSNGADKYALNNMGINVVHVAAQGD